MNFLIIGEIKYLLDKRDLSQRNHQKVEYASAQLQCQSHLNPEKEI